MTQHTIAAEAVVVDRALCRGRGVCAELAPDRISLDEWGYPVQGEVALSRRDTKTLVSSCPVRALYQGGRQA